MVETDDVVRAARAAFDAEVAALAKLQRKVQKWTLPWFIVPLLFLMQAVSWIPGPGWTLTDPRRIVGSLLYYGAWAIILVFYKLLLVEPRLHRRLRDGLLGMRERAAAAATDGTPPSVAAEYAYFVRGMRFLEMNGTLRKTYRLGAAPPDLPAA